MEINLLAVLVCAVVSMILGMIWYGPLFGKKWMEVIGMDPAILDDKERCKEMGKGMGKLYVMQFILSVIMLYSLAMFINMPILPNPVFTALALWAGFVLPVTGSLALWSGDKTGRLMWLRFFITAGFQLVLMVISALILYAWK